MSPDFPVMKKTKKRESSKEKDKDRDPNAPKKPANAFFMYCQQQRTVMQDDQKDPTVGHHELTKSLAKEWKSLATDDKKVTLVFGIFLQFLWKQSWYFVQSNPLPQIIQHQGLSPVLMLQCFLVLFSVLIAFPLVPLFFQFINMMLILVSCCCGLVCGFCKECARFNPRRMIIYHFVVTYDVKSQLFLYHKWRIITFCSWSIYGQASKRKLELSSCERSQTGLSQWNVELFKILISPEFLSITLWLEKLNALCGKTVTLLCPLSNIIFHASLFPTNAIVA